MPAPPPKENAWVKRSSNPPARSQSSDTEQPSPTSGGGKVAPAQPSEEGPSRKDETKVDGVSTTKGQTGHSSRGPGDGGSRDHWKELDRKDGKKIKTPDLHLSQRNLRRTEPLSSVLQASTLLCLWTVRMRMRETTALSRPPHLCFLLVSTLEHSRANQTSIQTRQNKLTIS